ncbi:hypothetical protein TURU_025317 [Turdus rufiventris]|nr:hypothetical protein TURU_025317 [Turdus rufiventris]
MTDNIPLQPVRQKKRMDSKHRGGCCECLRCCGRRDPRPRTVWLGHPEKREQRYPRNVINNQKYNFFTFLPGVLFNQFKYFFNLYFLLLACSQFVVEMRLGALYTYWVPLGFVLAVTVIREAAEEIRCYMRDKEVNSQIYSKLTARGTVKVKSSNIQVGDLIIVEKNQRVPADMIFLRTSEKNGKHLEPIVQIAINLSLVVWRKLSFGNVEEIDNSKILGREGTQVALWTTPSQDVVL